MASVGYSAGQRGTGSLGWAQNLAQDTIDQQAHTRNHMRKMSCLFAHIWNLALPYLPKVIVDDYEAASRKLGGTKMDAGAWENQTQLGVLKYKLPVGDEFQEREVSVLAPPQGQYAKNYFK
jgi:hypothetical protein